MKSDKGQGKAVGKRDNNALNHAKTMQKSKEPCVEPCKKQHHAYQQQSPTAQRRNKATHATTA